MDSTVVAAIISAIVSISGFVISLVAVRLNIRSANKEFILKRRELDANFQKLANDVEGVRQAQFSETLRKRLENYPKIWGTIQKFTINWNENKPKDINWVKEFLSAINKVDIEYGVFFSEAVYEKFFELQNTLSTLKDKLSLSENKTVEIQYLEKIDTIFIGRPGFPGLAAYLKDDLGSYRDSLIQARPGSSNIPTTVKRKMEEGLSVTESILDEKTINNLILGESERDLGPITSSITYMPNKENERTTEFQEDSLQVSGSYLIKNSKGIQLLGDILCKQVGFKNILTELNSFVACEISKQPNKIIDFAEPILTSGLIDSFHLVDLAIFIEDKFGVRIDDSELNSATFDTLLELTAIVYNRKKGKHTVRNKPN